MKPDQNQTRPTTGQPTQTTHQQKNPTTGNPTGKTGTLGGGTQQGQKTTTTTTTTPGSQGQQWKDRQGGDQSSR